MSFKPTDVIMDFTNSTVKTPEAEAETLTRFQPVKLTPFTKGMLKRHAPPDLQHPLVVIYKECRRNHAVEQGGHAVDGCGEFMSVLVSNPSDPSLLKCAACGCHRNFHRRELVNEVLPPIPILQNKPQQPREDSEKSGSDQPGSETNWQNSLSTSPSQSPSPAPISSSYAPHMLLSLGHGSGQPATDSKLVSPGAMTNNESNLTHAIFSSVNDSRKRECTPGVGVGKMLEFAQRMALSHGSTQPVSETITFSYGSCQLAPETATPGHASGEPLSDINPTNPGTVVNTEPNPDHPMFSSGSSRKRFRTRFSQDQKGKMVELAERIGWRMQKKDGDLISKLCSEIGVEKGVFKVWMHNNKSNYGKKENRVANSTLPPPAEFNYTGVRYTMHEQGNGGNRENHHEYGSSSC